jgi:predicted nucleic acid-binding protein
MIPAVVVDTDVASLVFKQQPGAEHYLQFMDGKECILSFMSLAELRRWPIAKQWGAFRRTKLEKYLESYSVSFCNDAATHDHWFRRRSRYSSRNLPNAVGVW